MEPVAQKPLIFSSEEFNFDSIPLDSAAVDVGCARCEDQLSGGRCPRLSIHPPTLHCARPRPDREERACKFITSKTFLHYSALISRPVFFSEIYDI